MNNPITRETVISSPAALKEAIMGANPVFMKIGEYLSLRPDALPAAYCYALMEISDDVPPEPWTTTRKYLEAAYGVAPESIFSHIEEKPLASHLIAQYHQAVAPDGKKVTLKIRRRGLEDILHKCQPDILQMAEGLAANHILRCTSAAGFAKDIENWLIREMDFSRELGSLGLFHKLTAGNDWVYTPGIYAEWSGPQVIVSEFIEKMPDGPNNDDSQIVHHLLTSCLDLIIKYRLINTGLRFNSILPMKESKIGLIAGGEFVKYEKSASGDIRRLLTCIYEDRYPEATEIIMRYISGDSRSTAGLRTSFRELSQPSSKKGTDQSDVRSVRREYTVTPELRELPVTQFAESLYLLLDKYKLGINPSVSGVLNMLSVSEMICLKMQNIPAAIQKMGQEYFFYQSIRDWAAGFDPSAMAGWPGLLKSLPLWFNERLSDVVDKGSSLVDQWIKSNERQDKRNNYYRLLILAVLSVSMALLLTVPLLQQPAGTPVRIMLSCCLAIIYIYILLKLIK